MPTSRVVVLIVAMTLGLPLPAAAQPRADARLEEGWTALQQGDGSRAEAVFEEALRQHPGDASLHFGAGAAAYLLGRHAEAAERLTRALELEPRLVPAAELLGELEYLRGDLAGAIERYERILPLAAEGAAAIRKRLDEWRKEASVHKRLTTTNDARFSLVFDGRTDNSLAVHAGGVLEREFQRIVDRIGAYPANRILITLYTEQQFRDITHGPAWSVGAFDGKIRIPIKGVAQDWEHFDRILVHELAHAVIYGLAPRGVPAWLHEGLASYFEREDVALAERRIQQSGVVIPFSELQESFGRMTAAQAAAAYDQSLVAADLLARALGTRLATLLRALGRGQTFSQAMAQVGLQSAEFEGQVMRRLKP